ncbi:FecR family protein [Pedobacter nyackensis]|uniref:FecR family protein n=1 Tax=Pedobacter nyackensis TaxID=475255 RepID=A0A1W2AC64_9SPHI|nr:FecR family protein [Pedobacter nyackensis]SMC58315.1 FecR family protein [Pedobacter nyackensis]
MKERINYLLSKFEEGKLSKVETAELLELTDSSEPHVADAIAEMINAQVPSSVIEANDWEAVFDNIVSVDRPTSKTGSILSLMSWVAAAVILITLGVGSWFYFNEGAQKSSNELQYANDVPPGGNEAILTLADGSKISLTDVGKGELLNTRGVRIVKTDDGQLVYTVDPTVTVKGTALSYNTITTPRGGQYQVNLPDGTKVWLNAASSIKFPTTFTNLKERKVELSGEAYFEVAKNKQQPFKVLSLANAYDRAQETEVLGTHFNINAYEDEIETKTTLLEGSVRVATPENRNKKYDVILSPGQQAVLSNNAFKISTVDTEEIIAWKNGNFVFANEGIESIMRKIARWYNVEVIYQGKITDNNFVGTVPRFGNISEALTILELTNTVHFKIEGRRVTVMP